VIGEKDLGKGMLGEVVEVMRGQGHGLVLSVLTEHRKKRKQQQVHILEYAIHTSLIFQKWLEISFDKVSRFGLLKHCSCNLK
jgi:hypothetical protein